MHTQAIAVMPNQDAVSRVCFGLDRVQVVGDAAQIDSATGLTTRVGSGDLSHDGYWFFELEAPLGTPRSAGPISAISFDAVFRSSDEFSERDWLGCTAEVVIRSRVMDLYVVSDITPALVAPGVVRTTHAISLSTSEPWRLAMVTDQMGELERVRTEPEDDPLANFAEIIEAVSSVTSLRLVFTYPPTTDEVELCRLSIV